MADISKWSQTDGSNVDSTKSGMPEGMARSDVNNRVREHMGAVRRWYEDAEWVDLVSGHASEFTLSRVNDTTFRAADVAGSGTNASSKFPVGTWVKISYSAGAVRYGSVQSVSYSAPNTDVVLADVMDGAYSSAGTAGQLIAGTVTQAATYIARRIRSAAFSPVGATTGQSPPQIPAIDDLQGHVLKPEGHTADNSGINADRLDDLHASDFKERDLEPQMNVVKNGSFGTWSYGTTFTAATDYPNNDSGQIADDWYLLSDGNDKFDVSRITTSSFLTSQVYGLQLEATGANNGKGGILQIVSQSSTRPLVQNGKASLTFQAKTASGDNFGSVSAMVLTRTTAVPGAFDPVTAWNANSVVPTIGNGWTIAGQLTNSTLGSSIAEFKLEDVTIPSTAYACAVFIYTNDNAYSATDLIQVAAVQLCPGDESPPFIHDVGGLENVYSSNRVSGDGTYLEIVATSMVANADGGPVAHGFGRPPRLLSHYARRKSAGTVAGYENGAIAYLGLTTSANASNGMTIGADDTNIWWNVGANGIYIIERDLAGTNANVQITSDADWELVIQVWK